MEHPTREVVIEVEWADRALERDCTDEKRAQRRFGAEKWKVLRRRLVSLKASPNLLEMKNVPGKCHILSGDRAGQFAMSITGSLRLIFESAEEPPPLLESGGLDQSNVTRVRIREVVDYHGN